MYFSQEGVQGIMQWGFWDQRHWLPCAAIATGEEVYPNEAGVAYQNIYHEFIRTKIMIEPVSLLKEKVAFEFRGFKGTYEVALVDESGNDVRILSSQMEFDDNVKLLF